MDFHELMHVAASKQEQAMKKTKKQRYSLDLPAPRREEKNKPKSETVQKLIQEKEREKQEKERQRQERDRKEREEIERREKEERKRNQFKIPKKKPEKSHVDKKQLIDSLFDDGDEDDSPQTTTEATSVRGDNFDSKTTSTSSHSKSSDKDSKRHSSSHRSHKSSSSHDDKKSHSSSKENHMRSSKSSSSSAKQENGLSSSSLSSSSSKQNGHHSSSSSSKHNGHHSSSKSHRESSKPSSSSHPKPEKSSKPESSTGDNSNYSNPIPLNKNHLNPIQDRHAENPYLSEKAKILARLQAIKERTKAAIAQENEGKGKRIRGAKTQRKSRAEEQNEKAKSAEIVKDVVSSDEEDLNDGPSALDIMLSERNAKLEKDRITRLAKQAWERATKGKEEEPRESTRKHKEHKHKLDKNRHSSSRDKSSSHKVKREGHASPTPSYKQETPRPKKPVIVKHAHNAAPPPINFQDILAIAEKKSKEPVKPAATFSIPKKKREEEKRPMTQEEKDRMERRKTKEYQDWLKFGGKQPKDKNRGSSSSDSEEQDEQKPESTHVSKLTQRPAERGAQPKSGTSSNHRHHQSGVPPASNHRKNIPVNENLLVCGPGEDEESEEDVAPTGGNPFDRIMKQVHKKRSAPQQPGGSSKRMRIDSEEEEEDSDMDDFIDDGDDNAFDASREIQSMFGYDRSKYKDEREDDLYNMEANFSTVMAEEKRSAKLGLMEDLEDIKREEEELRMKAALKKKMRRAK